MPKIFFFKSSKTGEVFAAENHEANIQQRFHQFLGSSDGRVYNKVLQEARDELHDLQVEIDELQSDLNMTDTEEVEARSKIRRALKEKQREYQKRFKPYQERAFQEELEIAKNNKEMPVPENRKEMTGDGDKLSVSVENGKKN